MCVIIFLFLFHSLLDIRTKLCLRDSLYRLAKNAEQRHNDSIANGCTGDDQACKSMVPHNGSSGYHSSTPQKIIVARRRNPEVLAEQVAKRKRKR
ncbi:hypothetical protein AAHE18_06G250800 [Arachis hypogaea]